MMVTVLEAVYASRVQKHMGVSRSMLHQHDNEISLRGPPNYVR